MRDKFSAGELAASTALGGVLGGAVGGVIGAVPAALGAARGIEAPEMLNRMGVTREDLAAMSPEDQDAFAANLRRSGASGLLPPTQDAPAPDAEVAAEPMNPVEAMKAKLETTTSLARDELNSLRRTGADEETVANATKYVSDLARLREGIARIEREAEQIRVLEGSSDPQDIARAAKMREGYETFLSDFSLLLDDIDAAGSPEEFIQTMRDRNFGGGGSETPPATPDAAPEAAPAGDQPPVTSEAAGDVPPSPPSPEAGSIAAKVQEDIEAFGANSRNAQSSEDGIRQTLETTQQMNIDVCMTQSRKGLRTSLLLPAKPQTRSLKQLMRQPRRKHQKHRPLAWKTVAEHLLLASIGATSHHQKSLKVGALPKAQCRKPSVDVQTTQSLMLTPTKLKMNSAIS